jgi:hypothetical protein
VSAVERLSRAERRFGHGEVLALLSALSFPVARFLPLLDLHLLCPFKGLTGLPCATCGMTHAFVHLAHGDLLAALAASPLGAAIAGLAWAFAALDLLRLLAGAPWPQVGPRAARGLAAAGLCALLANWAFLVAAARGLP